MKAVELYGGDIRPLTGDEVERSLTWLFHNGTDRGSTAVEAVDVYELAGQPSWALLQCSDTLVWGVYDTASASWMWASDAVAENEVRAPTRGSLREARIFGEKAELLIVNEGGAPVGRVLSDKSGALLKWIDRELEFEPRENHPNEEARPGQHTRNPAKTVEELGSGFRRRTMHDGRVTITPKGKAVLVRDYVADADDTGIVRVAATRFVKVVE